MQLNESAIIDVDYDANIRHIIIFSTDIKRCYVSWQSLMTDRVMSISCIFDYAYYRKYGLNNILVSLYTLTSR